MATRPGVPCAMQGPTFDANLPVRVCVDRAAETLALWSDARLCAGLKLGFSCLSVVGVPCLLHEVRTVCLLHCVVSVAMKDDERHSLFGFTARRSGSTR